jgi:hypothetical protein
MFVVIQKYYDSGKVDAYIEEMEVIPDYVVWDTAIDRGNHDLYYNGFNTLEKAERFKQECFEA